MKLLHTSDWHLGRTLYSKKERVEEHTAFLDWLLTTLKSKLIDILLIAGDIFDTSSPNSTSQTLYYDFLIKARDAGCKNIIVVGGNHDSPSFLNAPKHLLKTLNVTVIGNISDSIEDEIVVIHDSQGKPSLIVCGVPFIRERDISRFAEGENYADRASRINESIKKHYNDIALLAEGKRANLGTSIPIIATGHLSVAGGKRNDDDGVRETYVGNIEVISSDIFPDTFDYVALGHYHVPSTIKEHIRYSGSPIAMGFGEAKQTKCVYILDFENELRIETLSIPVFQKLESIAGDKNHIEQRINELKTKGESVWVEVIYKGQEIFPDFSNWLSEQIDNTKIEILKQQNRQYLNEVLSINDTTVPLDELDAYEVFEKLLDKNDIPEEQRQELIQSYNEILINLDSEAK